MILKEDRARSGGDLLEGGRRGCFGKFLIFVNHHAVDPNCHPSELLHFAVLVKLRSREIDVVGLPSERRKAHVDPRVGDRVDAAKFVFRPFEPKRIKDLRFVAAVVIDAAITTTLTSGVRFIGRANLQVHGVVAEGLLAGRSAAE